MTQHLVDQLKALASRWDLEQLHQDLTGILEAVGPDARTFVPTHLAEALHMYLDSYGSHGAANR